MEKGLRGVRAERCLDFWARAWSVSKTRRAAFVRSFHGLCYVWLSSACVLLRVAAWICIRNPDTTLFRPVPCFPMAVPSVPWFPGQLHGVTCEPMNFFIPVASTASLPCVSVPHHQGGP